MQSFGLLLSSCDELLLTLIMALLLVLGVRQRCLMRAVQVCKGAILELPAAELAVVLSLLF